MLQMFMLIHVKKTNWPQTVAFIGTLFFSCITTAHDKIVVIPLFGDALPRAYAPLKTDEAPRADYFILSDTARDLVTGLEWQRSEAEFSYNWQDAIEICRDMVLGEFTDWRLPTIKELIGITDYTQLSPALSVQAFPNPKSALDYWSSTVDPSSGIRLRTLDISNGEVTKTLPTSSGYVRCVRAGNSNGSTFIDNGDGTVQDLSFGLMWEKPTFSQYFGDLSLARGYCLGLSLGGYRDWRMPSVKELTSLLDSRAAVEMNRIFPYQPNNSSEALYTRTNYAGGTPPDGVWVVRFNALSELPLVGLTPLENNFNSSVKCVRNIN